ncbi:MAG: alpha/beta hydrolase [Mariniblastus sp.]|nr:alpha/beta hydrolase [Mariniblastus sp.]
MKIPSLKWSKPKSLASGSLFLFLFWAQAAGITQEPRTLPDNPGRAEAGPDQEDDDRSDPRSATEPDTRFKFKKHGAIEYTRGENYRLTLDVYQPEGEGPFPAVLAVHGGAWRSGSKITMIRHAWKLAAAGYVVVAINYRHAPEHKFPAQIHDCKQAVRWMRIHADEYSIDPQRIAAFGYSAGGHLAALLGTTCADDNLEGTHQAAEQDQVSTRVQAVIAGGAVCDFAWVSPESRLLEYWIGATRQTDPAAYLTASPIHYVSRDDPPFYFFHGEEDAIVPLASSRRMHRKLVAQGTPSEFRQVTGKGHLATFGDIQQMNGCIDFLKKQMPEPTGQHNGDSQRRPPSHQPTAREAP